MTTTNRHILAALLLLASICSMASASNFTFPPHLAKPIGEGYLLSKSYEFSSKFPSVQTLASTESLKVFAWSSAIDATDMKKAEYKVRFDSGEKFEGDLENVSNGYFAISLDFGGEEGPLGDAMISVELEDKSRIKYKHEDIPITRVDAANRASSTVKEDSNIAPTTSAPTLSKSPSTSPTPSPSSEPSIGPTVPCIHCSNDPSGAMAIKNRTCESFRLTESKCADAAYAWKRDTVCKRSCYFFGYAYDDDKCCPP